MTEKYTDMGSLGQFEREENECLNALQPGPKFVLQLKIDYGIGPHKKKVQVSVALVGVNCSRCRLIQPNKTCVVE